MESTPTAIAEVLATLAETSERIRTAARDRTNEQLAIRPDPDNWSVAEVLAHLRACVDVWEVDMRAMLTQETPTLRHLSPRTYIRKTDYPTQPFWPSFENFAARRETLLALLQGLSGEDWSRGALIKDRVHTVFTHARRLALHERRHCDQLETLLGG